MMTATNKIAKIAGKASASVRAVLGSLLVSTSANAGTTVIANSTVTITPAASSKPAVAWSDCDTKYVMAARSHPGWRPDGQETVGVAVNGGRLTIGCAVDRRAHGVEIFGEARRPDCLVTGVDGGIKSPA